MSSSEDVLQTIGVSEAEETVYGVVVDLGAMGATEIADRTGFPLQRVRGLLKSLETKGLVNRVADSPKYSAAPCDVALNVLLLQHEERLERARAAVNRWTERYRKGSSVTTRAPAELVDMVTGQEGVRQRFLQLQEMAREEVLVIDKPPYVAPPPYNIAEFAARIERGVRFRTIYDKSSLEYEGRSEDIRSSIDMGEEAALHPDVPMKLVLIDREVALLPLTAGPGTVEGALVAHPSSLVDGLVKLWHFLWAESTVLTQARDGLASMAPREAELEEVDAEVVTMLLGGLKSQAIARQLGLGKSTVERRIVRIIKKLGAETRFEAGFRLAEMRYRSRGAENGPSSDEGTPT